MRLIKLKATNFKGRSFDHELAPLTWICGKRATGKSSRIQALKLLLLGYLPGVGKKANELFNWLASGNTMSIVGDLMLGQMPFKLLSKTWEIKGGKVSHKSSHDDTVISSIALDATEYLSKSAVERTKFLFSKMTLPKEYGLESLKIRIAAELQVAAKSNAAYGTCLTGEVINYQAETTQEWLEHAIKACHQDKLDAEAVVERLAKTSQGLTQIATEEMPPANAEQIHRDARAALDDANKRYAAVGGKLTQSRVGYATLAAKINSTAYVKSEPALRKALADAEKRIETMPRVMKPEDRTKIDEALESATRLKNQRDMAVLAGEEQITRLKKQIEEGKKKRVCPTCGQGIQSQKKSIEAEIKKNLAKLTKDQKAVESLATEAKLSFDNATVISKDWLSRNTRYAEYLQQLRTVEGEIATAKEQLVKISNLDALRTQLSQIVDEGKRLKEEAEKLSEEVIAKSKAAEDAGKNYDRLLALRAEDQAKAKANEQATEAAKSVEVFKTAYTTLCRIQAELVEAAIKPFLDKCNALCGDILETPMAYLDGEIGRVQGNRFITHRTFSGTEEALCHAAISIALASQQDLKLVILDELGRFDDDSKIVVTQRIIKLIKDGTIDQAIMVDTKQPAINDGVMSVIAL